MNLMQRIMSFDMGDASDYFLIFTEQEKAQKELESLPNRCPSCRKILPESLYCSSCNIDWNKKYPLCDKCSQPMTWHPIQQLCFCQSCKND